MLSPDQYEFISELYNQYRGRLLPSNKTTVDNIMSSKQFMTQKQCSYATRLLAYKPYPYAEGAMGLDIDELQLNGDEMEF